MEAVVTARRSVGDPFVVIDATTVAQNSVLAFRKNNFNRWLMYTDNSSESGGNAGSDFKLDAYNNAGGIANYLIVKRSNGFVGIGTATPVAKLEVRDGALAITNGAIRVTGAGVNTSTPVFVHVKTAANECGTTATIIDNTYTNNDPSAILIVTQNVGTINPNAPVAAGDIYLRYGDQDLGCSVFGGLNRWMIYSTTGNMPNGTRFNVMVIKP